MPLKKGYTMDSKEQLSDLYINMKAEHFFEIIHKNFKLFSSNDIKKYESLPNKDDQRRKLLRNIIKAGNDRFLTDSYLLTMTYQSYQTAYPFYFDEFSANLDFLANKDQIIIIFLPLFKYINRLNNFGNQVYKDRAIKMFTDLEKQIYNKLLQYHIDIRIKYSLDYYVDCISELLPYFAAAALYFENPNFLDDLVSRVLFNPEEFLEKLYLNNFLSYDYRRDGQLYNASLKNSTNLLKFVLKYNPKVKREIR